MRDVKKLVFIGWVLMVMLACSMGTSTNEPPTVITPRTMPTLPPPPIIGYNTPIPGQNVTPTPPREQINPELSSQRLRVDVDRMMRDIRALQNFETRHINSTNSNNRGVLAAHDYLRQQFEFIQSVTPPDVSFEVESQQFDGFYNDVASDQYNVIGRMQGTEVGAGTIVIGAHYDSRTDDLFDADSFSPGADDNGSGVSAVLELARILTQSRHRASIIFVLFAAEEVNRQGSRAFVTDYIDANDINLIAMFNLDTIGSNNDPNGNTNDTDIRMYSDNDNSNTSSTRHLARILDFFGQNYGLPLDIDYHASLDRDGRYGDQQSFVDAGYPAVRFIEALEDTPNREGNDLIDYIEPDYLLSSTQTILNLVFSMVDGLQPPDNVTLRELDSLSADGNTQYQLVWNAVAGASRYIVVLRPPGELTYDVSYQFTVEANEVIWDGFDSFIGVAVAAVDANGLIGRLSTEFVINPNAR